MIAFSCSYIKILIFLKKMHFFRQTRKKANDHKKKYLQTKQPKLHNHKVIPA